MSIVFDGQPLTNRGARAFLDKYLQSKFDPLQSYSSFSYGFVYDMPPGEGVTRVEMQDGVETLEYMNIGIFDSLSVDSKLVNAPVDEYEFMTMLIAIPHEYQHVSHCLVDYHTDKFPGPELYVDFLACAGNENYYHTNYSNCVSEIDAQFRGLFEVYELLQLMVGTSEAERLICMYQNRRQAELREQHEVSIANREAARKAGDEHWADMYVMPLDFIDRKAPYTSVNEIFDAYHDKFLKSIHMKREYDFENVHTDRAAEYLRSHAPHARVFQKEKDGFQQDQMLASLNFMQPHQVKYILPKIQEETGLDLSRRAAFHNVGFISRTLADMDTRQREYDPELRFGDILEQLARRDEDDTLDLPP